MASRTRSSTYHFLVGQGEAQLPASQLPAAEDVLREILFKEEQESGGDIETSISCKVTRDTPGPRQV